MFGQLSNESEIKAPAATVWELYRGLKLGKLVEKYLSDLIQKVELVEGDGGEGTVLKLIFAPGFVGPPSYKEKFTKIDDENRIKETEVVEGGYLDLGFTLYRVRFEIIEKDEESSIVKSTIEYEVNEESKANASFVTIQPLIDIVDAANKHFLTNQHNLDY